MSKIEGIKLLPCPFCGCKAKIYKGKQNFLIYKQKCYSVFCESCKCTTQYERTEKESVDDWNRRIYEQD